MLGLHPLAQVVLVLGFWRAHQVPIADVKKSPEHLQILETWMRSYRPDELFTTEGAPAAIIRNFVPQGDRRMGSNPKANGGKLKRALKMPNYSDFALAVERPGQIEAENTRPLGQLLREIMRANITNFRVFGPDENTSNKLNAVYEVSQKLWLESYFPEDSDGGELAMDGRVVEMLSEHTLEGMLEEEPE